MLKPNPKEISRGLADQAEKLFGSEHAQEMQTELDAMAEQLAMLRATPVDLQDEP